MKSLKLHKMWKRLKSMAEEIEKLVKGTKNVEDNVKVASSPLRNEDNQTILDTRLEPKSDKERPKVDNIADISQPVNPDYKNLNKNDIEDIYLLIINHKVDDYAETGLLCGKLSAISQSYCTTITFPGIKKYEMFSIITDLVYGIIYKNSKKEKRVMRHQEIHKLCDATLKRVLEGLKSYNNNVKYGYVTSSLSKEDVEYLQLFAEEIEERLKRRDQMRRWEIYVNERPLGSRREHLE
ncbi:hypothetical protein Tco_0020201 [Tanacetum coccineum]